MICKSERFFISLADRLDINVENKESMIDKDFPYFLYEFMEDKGYAVQDFIDIDFDFEEGIIKCYKLLDTYIDVYSVEHDIYSGMAQSIPTEKSMIVLPIDIDHEKYGLFNLAEPVLLDKVVWDFNTGEVLYYVQVYTDYDCKVENLDLLDSDYKSYLKNGNFDSIL